MKALLRASALALAFIALPSLAHAWGTPPSPCGGVNVGLNFNVTPYPGWMYAQAGPWYQYYPYNAYFQTPAPVGGWPYWPTPAPVAVPPAGYVPSAVAAPTVQTTYGTAIGTQR